MPQQRNVRKRDREPSGAHTDSRSPKRPRIAGADADSTSGNEDEASTTPHTTTGDIDTDASALPKTYGLDSTLVGLLKDI